MANMAPKARMRNVPYLLTKIPPNPAPINVMITPKTLDIEATSILVKPMST